jgi:hypothetical protein
LSAGVKAVVYYESIKRELFLGPIHECRCDERLNGKGGGIYTPRIHWVPWGTGTPKDKWFDYYESIKRELKIKPISECRCYETLKTKAEESTRLAYTGLLGKLEHLKIETKLRDQKFASVRGEYVFVK